MFSWARGVWLRRQWGNWVKIGKDGVILKFSIIKDCERNKDGPIIAPYTVIRLRGAGRAW
ncbi:hypothetical protein BGX38DRAFT_1202636 [Terfezia claveryi]|nr:hypothetical protein BGX38DRAFT_1202636 [Terfezia claveryi]